MPRVNVIPFHENTNDRFIAEIRANRPELAILICMEERGDVNHVDETTGESVSHAAAKSNHGLQLFHFLWENPNFDETSVNDINQDGLTPLTLAAQNGDLDTVRYMLTEWPGEDRPEPYVNAIEDGFETYFTALHAAARGGFEEIADLLVENGADVTILDSDGRTAAQVAQAHGHETLAQDLLPEENDQVVTALLGSSAALPVDVDADDSNSEGTVDSEDIFLEESDEEENVQAVTAPASPTASQLSGHENKRTRR